jgi:hypothetical protein
MVVIATFVIRNAPLLLPFVYPEGGLLPPTL